MRQETAVDKVMKLVRLASSPNEEEGRSAAYKAAALIREFNLVVVDPVQYQPPPPRSSAPWFDDAWIAIESRYAGLCKTCRKPYRVGEYILWKRKVGCVHDYCPTPD